MSYEPLRPYRLERSDRNFGTTTYATEERARKEAAWASEHVGDLGGFRPGTKWRIVKRLNKSGTKFEVIAEGVTP